MKKLFFTVALGFSLQVSGYSAEIFRDCWKYAENVEFVYCQEVGCDQSFEVFDLAYQYCDRDN